MCCCIGMRIWKSSAMHHALQSHGDLARDRNAMRGTWHLTQRKENEKMKLSIEQRKQLASRIEQKIGDMLRDEGVLMDGYMVREVESVSSKLAHDAVLKKKELAGTR